MSKTLTTIAAGFIASAALFATAGTAAAAEGPANENAKSCTLANGVEYSSVGHMMQHLRDRDYNLAGTPKDIADVWFHGKVKNLIDAKCA